MITDVPGVRVGHVTDTAGLTGATVVLCDRPAVAGIELRGGANDVVGLDFLAPDHLVGTVNGAVLAGGSRFGEEAVYGGLQYLEEHGVGFAVGPTVVPHVPGAFLFDLNVGDARARPTRVMGYDAAARAVNGPVAEGNVGAGTGATVGKLYGVARAMRGGLGSASGRLGEVVVGALIAVNAVGDVRERQVVGVEDEFLVHAATGRDRPDVACVECRAKKIAQRRVKLIEQRLDRRASHRREGEELERVQEMFCPRRNGKALPAVSVG